MINKIEHITESAHKCVIYKINIYHTPTTTYPTTIYVTYSPTGNCQTMAMSTFSNLLHKGFSNEDIIQIFKYIYTYLSKRILLLDINEYNHRHIKSLKLTKEQLFFSKPYCSTNNSRMRMLMINLTKL